MSSSLSHRDYSQDEVAGFVDHINAELGADPDLAYLMPIDRTNQDLFQKVSDGVLLCKLCNLISPAIPEVSIVKPSAGKKYNVYSQQENRTLLIGTAKSLGAKVVNVGGDDIRDGTIHIVLGLVWQLIRLLLTREISLKHHPELFRLLEGEETLQDFLKLSPEDILLRWLNYHLARGGSSRKATNFSGDLKDSEILTIVMKQIAPEFCTMKPMEEGDLSARAELVLQEADKIECRKFATPDSIVRGNARLNLAFVATLFNTRPGLEVLSEAEKVQLDEALFQAEGTRLERQFCIWMNSLDLEEPVTNLDDAMANGLTLLQLEDKIEPGCVDWSRVKKMRKNKFMIVQNLDYGIQILKDLGVVVVGIGGSDLYDKNTKYNMALLEQVMRREYTKMLKQVGGGVKIKDEQIVAWANSKTSGQGVTISSFRDESISTSKPLLTLIEVLKPGTVDWSVFSESEEVEDKMRNAKYAISIVRKFGGNVYALPEDVVEVVPHMVMTLYASLMAM